MTPCVLCLNFTNLRLLCVFTSPPFLLNSFQALDFTIGKFHNRRINCSYFVTAQAPSSTVNAIDGGSRFHQLLPPSSFFFCPLAILLCRCVCAGCRAPRRQVTEVHGSPPEVRSPPLGRRLPATCTPRPHHRVSAQETKTKSTTDTGAAHGYKAMSHTRTP